MKHHKLEIDSMKNYHRLTLADREEISRELVNTELKKETKRLGYLLGKISPKGLGV